MAKFTTEVRLSREMTLLDATLIGVGAMIGAGIFVLTGIAAGVAGPALIITFALNGFVALMTAMAYAELGSCFHDAGGGYLWVKEGLPHWNGFLAGWMSWFAHSVACSLYALGFAAYFDHVLRALGTSLPEWGGLSSQKLIAACVALLFAYVNFRGASETGKIGNMVTLTKIVILMIFIAFGIEVILRKGNLSQALTPFMPHGWSGVVKAMGLTFIAFEGYEVISQCSEEVQNPRKTIPRAVFLSLIIVVPIYLLVAITSLGAVDSGSQTPWDYLAARKETALVEVAQGFFRGGGILLLVGGLISTMSALNATIFSSSRVAFAMGRDHNFPTLFSRIHRKNFTPHLAIMISLVIIVLMAVSLPIEDVASAADIMFLLLFLQVNVTLIRLRKKRPDLDRGFVTPLFPWLSVLGIASLLFLAVYMFNYSPIAWVVTIAWIGVGLVVYRFYAAQREVEHIERVHALERLERKEYRILVALSRSSPVRSLATIAAAVAKRNNAEIILLHVIEVRENQLLRAGLEEREKGTEFLNEVAEVLVPAGVPVRTILRVSHRISQGIVETVQEEHCNFVILARRKQPSIVERLFSSVIDTVIQKTPCEVAVLHGELPMRKIETMLIPYAQDSHTRLAMEVAPALSTYLECDARILAVFPPGIDAARRESQRHRIDQLLEETGLDAEVDVINDRGILQAVVERARSAGLVVMGGTTGDFLELLLGRSLVQEITDEVRCPVLWLREYEERESFWAALLKSPAPETEVRHGSIAG
jgi:amino acid transporter/nucleotide-binding universal stress UspA family protein